jgi:hypothetical protein
VAQSQYFRNVRVEIEGGATFNYDGEADGGRGLRIRFETHQRDSSTPNIANIIITNLKDSSTQPAFFRGKTVTLSVGYGQNIATIFKGQIRQTRNLREDVTDKVLHILATDQSEARNYAVVNKTLAAGHTQMDRVQAAVDAMKQFGVTQGYIAKDALTQTKFPRGFAMFGNAKDMLREICRATRTSWSIQNGVFQLLENDKPKLGGIIVLNSSTGLVGLPEQTIQGIQGRALLNTQISPGCLVKIDQKSIQQAAIDPSYTGAGRTGTNDPIDGPSILPAIATDGIYKIFVAEHDGDTRGNNFYTSFTGIKNGDNISVALSSRGIDTPKQ